MQYVLSEPEIRKHKQAFWFVLGCFLQPGEFGAKSCKGKRTIGQVLDCLSNQRSFLCDLFDRCSPSVREYRPGTILGSIIQKSGPPVGRFHEVIFQVPLSVFYLLYHPVRHQTIQVFQNFTSNLFDLFLKCRQKDPV